MKTKVCLKCGKNKNVKDFYKDKSRADGLCNICIECRKEYVEKNKEKFNKQHQEYCRKNYIVLKKKHDNYMKKYKNKFKRIRREYNLKRSFNMTLAEFDFLLKKQNNKCAICGKLESANSNIGKIRPLSVDHDHKTGKVRGLLCNKCNQAIGLFSDDINMLFNAIKYLQETEE